MWWESQNVSRSGTWRDDGAKISPKAARLGSTVAWACAGLTFTRFPPPGNAILGSRRPIRTTGALRGAGPVLAGRSDNPPPSAEPELLSGSRNLLERTAQAAVGRSQVPFDLVEIAEDVVAICAPDLGCRRLDALEHLVEGRGQRCQVGCE